MKITAKNSEQFIHFETIAKELGYGEDSNVQISTGILGAIVIEEMNRTSSIWISKKLEIDCVAIRIIKDDYDNELIRIDTDCLLNKEKITIRNYCDKNETPFVKSLSRARL